MNNGLNDCNCDFCRRRDAQDYRAPYGTGFALAFFAGFALWVAIYVTWHFWLR